MRVKEAAAWMAVVALAPAGPASTALLHAAPPQNAGEPLAFEVASVKENTSGQPGGRGDRFATIFEPGGRFTARNATLQDLVLTAYRDEFAAAQMSGFTDWMLQKRFDVDARARAGDIPGGGLSRETARLIQRMLQSMLADRFDLRVRRDARVEDVHVLKVAAGGHKMKPVRDAACAGRKDPGGPAPSQCHMLQVGRDGLEGSAVNTADITGALQFFLQRPVVDRANLTDLYDVSARWNPGLSDLPDQPSPRPQSDSKDPDMYTALREQLGLTLDIETRSVPVLIIESAVMPKGT